MFCWASELMVLIPQKNDLGHIFVILDFVFLVASLQGSAKLAFFWAHVQFLSLLALETWNRKVILNFVFGLGCFRFTCIASRWAEGIAIGSLAEAHCGLERKLNHVIFLLSFCHVMVNTGGFVVPSFLFEELEFIGGDLGGVVSESRCCFLC